MTAYESGPTPQQGRPNATTSDLTSELGNFEALTSEETARALDIARELVKAGVPVFVAPPADTPLGFKLPAKWETSTPTLDVVNRWRPGWALAAVCGHAVDVLDVDPRNGGEAGAAGLKAAGMWPNTYGQAATPSGGTHDLIAPLRVGKGVAAGGVDLQGGREDGTGRGFVFIAPTVRRSKVDDVTRPYRWVVEPDLDRLAESAETDDSGAALAAAFTSRKASAPIVDDDSPFATAADMRGGGSGVAADSPETVRRVMQLRDELASAPHGEGNTLAAGLAYKAGQYVGAGQISVETATGIMLSALDGWTFAPDSPRSVMEGTIRRQVTAGAGVPRTWEASRRATADGQDGGAGRLRAALLKRSEMGNLPVPVPLIEDVMHRETIVVLAGKFGSYKSFVTVGMGCSLASGRPWMGHEVPEAVPVLYVAAEGAYGIRKRVDAWEAAYGPVPDTFYLLPVPARLLVPEDVAEIDELVGELGIKVLIVDTLHASAPGADEDKSKEIGPLYDTLRGLRERHGLTTILVHHTGHAGERARGSSAIEDDADTSFVIKLEGDGRDADTQRTLHHRKAKDGALLEPISLKLTLVEGTGSGYVEPGQVEGQPDRARARELQVQAFSALLDRLGLDRTAGRDKCREVLAANKHKVKTDLLADAIRYRKGLSGQGEMPSGQTGQVIAGENGQR